MNLQEEMRDAIDAAEIEEIKHSAIYKTDVDKAAKSCAEIAERNAIEFAEWLLANYYPCSNSKKINVWCEQDFIFIRDVNTEDENLLTTENLYQLFLNSKDNE